MVHGVLYMKKKSEAQRLRNALALVTQLGFTMAACVFIGVLAGKYLDMWLGTSPWLLLLGAVLGAASAFKVLYDTAIKEWNDK